MDGGVAGASPARDRAGADRGDGGGGAYARGLAAASEDAGGDAPEPGVRADAGVLRGGRVPAVTEVLRVARETGALTLAVTNDPDSPLAGTAELPIDVAAGHERAVAATKTYTAELLALLLLVEGIRAGDGSCRPRSAPRCRSCRSSPRACWPTAGRTSWPSGTGSPPGWSPPAGGTPTRPPGRPR